LWKRKINEQINKGDYESEVNTIMDDESQRPKIPNGVA
jgi:hypothetical protein